MCRRMCSIAKNLHKFLQTSVVSQSDRGHPARLPGCPALSTVLLSPTYKFLLVLHSTLYILRCACSQCWQICKLTSSCVLRFIERHPNPARCQALRFFFFFVGLTLEGCCGGQRQRQLDKQIVFAKNCYRFYLKVRAENFAFCKH